MATKNSAKSVWEVLSKIDCKNHIEKKGDISYVSWTYAWAMTKDAFPDATFTKHTLIQLITSLKKIAYIAKICFLFYFIMLYIFH